LAAKGNEYEIVNFLKTNARYMVGTEDLPAKDNALADDDTVNRRGLLDDIIDETDEESNLQAEADANVANFPEKIDNLLVYINDTYFEGQLDLQNKGILREDELQANQNDQSENNEENLQFVFNSDEGPARQRHIYRSD
jgi:hypothetical protein